MGFNGKDSIGFSAHGFRATASTILNEAGYRADVIERPLAHKERYTVRASYNQAEYLAERREMMQQWADLVDGLAEKKVGVKTSKAKKVKELLPDIVSWARNILRNRPSLACHTCLFSCCWLLIVFAS